MAKFKPAKITSQGQQMMMQDLNGEIDLQFTRIVFGDGEYTEEDYSTITARTALKSQKQSFNINSMGILSKNSLLLGVVADNTELSEGYSMREIGLFARDSNDLTASEKLYAIVVAEDGCADYMPAYNGNSTVRVRQNFQVDVVDASTVTIEVTDSAVVSQSYLEEFYYNKIQTDAMHSECLKHKVVNSCTSASQVTAYATNTEFINGRYNLVFNVAENAVAAFGFTQSQIAYLTFLGDYPILIFPKSGKTFRYVNNKWERVYSDTDPASSIRVNRLSNNNCSSLKDAYVIYENNKDDYDIVYFDIDANSEMRSTGDLGKIDCVLGMLFLKDGKTYTAKSELSTFVLNN